MKTYQRYFIFFLMLLTAVLSASSAAAQFNAYQRLSFRYNQPDVYLTTFTLPGESQNSVQLTAAFRINYGLLTFKKVDEPGSERFYATASLHLEIYKSPRKNLRFKEPISIVDLEYVTRASWSDTVYTTNYEATTNTSEYATGFIQVQLPPGHYTYILQLSKNGSTDKQTSSTRNIHIYPYESYNRGEIIFAGSVDEDGSATRLNLMNWGGNVLYTKSFYALIHLPDYSSDKSYRVKVHRVRIAGGDTVRVETVFEEAVSSGQIITGAAPEMTSVNDHLFLKLQQNENGHAYTLVQIPNSQFSEAVFKIEVIEQTNGETVAQKVYHSIWVDKPISLHNIDVAIDMLHFITNEQTLERIESGSTAEEREKFADFWEKRDPTPNTAFNELKAEYYKRIDYAYEHFTSRGTLGFETDRGRIYILYGPPNNIDRVYPPEGTTREIWTYDNRRFVFKATSGYGDFKLISN